VRDEEAANIFKLSRKVITMQNKAVILGCLAAAAMNSLYPAEGPIPGGVPHLDHVFVIMMENHSYSQILDNPNAPYINQLASIGNTATNYFAVAHPSLTNYLEVNGGSNFGIQTDNYPDWHSTACQPNLETKVTSFDNPASGLICPIVGVGTDAATIAIDTTNETTGAPGILNIDGVKSIPATDGIVGKTIADQLAERGRTWKSYEESLPASGADGVNYSDGFFTNNTDFTKITPTLTPALTQGNIVFLYAVKHNPFAYFTSIQEGDEPGSSLDNTVGFETLYADLAAGKVPTYSFIAPNQCNDQHGRGNGTAFCAFDPVDNGTQAGLNPALILQGDVTVRRIVTAIKDSPVWFQGNNAIVVLWDENDYSIAPDTNQVLLIVDTNYGAHGKQSSNFYTHFSLLKSIESGLGLPCLNHACDSDVNVMADLFSPLP
jgi:phosphatidylinositol-3-phosphatase